MKDDWTSYTGLYPQKDEVLRCGVQGWEFLGCRVFIRQRQQVTSPWREMEKKREMEGERERERERERGRLGSSQRDPGCWYHAGRTGVPRS